MTLFWIAVGAAVYGAVAAFVSWKVLLLLWVGLILVHFVKAKWVDLRKSWEMICIRYFRRTEKSSRKK